MIVLLAAVSDPTMVSPTAALLIFISVIGAVAVYIDGE
mgnify:FL=1